MRRAALAAIAGLVVLSGCGDNPIGAPKIAGNELVDGLHQACADHGGVVALAPRDQQPHGSVQSYVTVCKDQTIWLVKG